MREPWDRTLRWWRYKRDDRPLERREREAIIRARMALTRLRSAPEEEKDTRDREYRSALAEEEAATNARLELATRYWLVEADRLMVPRPQGKVMFPRDWLR